MPRRHGGQTFKRKIFSKKKGEKIKGRNKLRTRIPGGVAPGLRMKRRPNETIEQFWRRFKQATAKMRNKPKEQGGK